MRTWTRAHAQLLCGGPCRGSIRKGSIFLVITTAGNRRARCAACAKRLFDEDAPATVTDPEPIAVPVPTLPMAFKRKPDFVTPRNIQRPAVIRDVKALQSGERESGEEG